MWSSASPLPLAAVIAMLTLSLILVCPMKPSKRRGRRLVSSGISSTLGLPDIIRSILTSLLVSYLINLPLLINDSIIPHLYPSQDKSVIEVSYQESQSGFQRNQEFLWVLNRSEVDKQSQQRNKDTLLKIGHLPH